MTNDEDDTNVADGIKQNATSPNIDRVTNIDDNNSIQPQNVRIKSKLPQVPSIKEQQKDDVDNLPQHHQQIVFSARIIDQMGSDDVEDEIEEDEVEDDEEEEEDVDDDDEDDEDEDDDDEEENNDANNQLEVAAQDPNLNMFFGPHHKSSASPPPSSQQQQQMQIKHHQPQNSPNRPSTSSNETTQHNHQIQQQIIHHHQHQEQINHHEHHHHHQQQQQQQLSHQNHIQLLMNALEKLDPDKNGLVSVPKEITSSTLTTRLKGVSKINRLIDYANDLCHSFSEIGYDNKYQLTALKFKNWIVKNNIIEHIFGPNCHVEIIKPSHTILNFVAPLLNEEHVNVIWSASLLKHCGRQVLDLLTSLVRFMHCGPVLHLYSLVKNLNVEDHSEHTLLLTSHILRFIWSHSPCINEAYELASSQPSSQSSNPEDESFNKTQHNEDQFIKATNAMDTIQDGEWLQICKSNDLLDSTSDASACCSEEKDMNDFEEDDQSYVHDESNFDVQGLSGHVNTSSSASDLFPPTLSRQYLILQQQLQQHNIEAQGANCYDESPSRLSNSNVDATTSNMDINDDSNDEASRGSSSSQSAKSKSEQQNIDHNHQYHQEHHNQQHQEHMQSITQYIELKKISYRMGRTAKESNDDRFTGFAEFNLVALSKPGNTLLWDLLQDGKIEHLAANLHVEIENVLVNLIMSFGDRYIRYRFIEACLENLSEGTSVILSLRLLPRLLSFNTITRNLPAPAINETHTIVLWAEREYNMSQNFFKSLVEYYRKRQHQQHKLIMASKEQLSASRFTEAQQQEILLRQQQQILELEYDGEQCKSPLFSHIDKIITRMSFLTFIYSSPFSPDSMRLTREQLDQLWDCLSSDSNLKCSDVLFQWIYQQSMSDDFHGLNGELFDYILDHKLPSLEPENFRLRGLKLLEQLIWNKQEYECCHGLENPATRLLWDIGLKAIDDEVSMAAIRILNHFYIYSNHNNSLKCDKGINLMSYCMNQLSSTLTSLTKLMDSDKKEGEGFDNEMNHLLDVLQRVILLIRTHLEVFRAHWSFYLRILQLNNEADLVSHRLNAYEIKLTMTIRIVCEAASTMDKTTIEVQAGDFVGELRAEIVKWWYTQVNTNFFKQTYYSNKVANSKAISSHNALSPESSSSSTTSTRTTNNLNDDDENHQDNVAAYPESSVDDSINPNALHVFTEFLLANRHSLRLLSHNQEIPHDWDERQINELDIKDMQVIYVLNDIVVPNNPHDSAVDEMDESNKSNESNQTNYTPKTEIPSILLLRHDYFERLMEADRFLGLFHCKNNDLNTRTKTLSRRVWEIIQILPTCPHYKDDLERCGQPSDDWRLSSPQCSNVLSAECPQRLLYSLQIIDILKSSGNPEWGSTFIRKGGLGDIFDVFMIQKLLPEEDEDWNEWYQECLAYLLKLLFQFGTRPTIAHRSFNSNDSHSSSSSSSSKVSIATSNRNIVINNTSGPNVKRIRRNRGRIIGSVSADDRLPIPLFSEELLGLLANTDQVFEKLIRILTCSAFCKSQSDQYYYVTMSSRAMIVHHVMSFLSSWCRSDRKFPQFQIGDYEHLVKALILYDTDSSTRREACNGFFKLHHSCVTTSAFRSRSGSQSTTSNIQNTSVYSIHSTINSSLMETLSSTEIDNTPNNDNYENSSDQSLSNWSFSADLLKCLIKFLPIAESMKPPRPIRNYATENDYIKELNSSGCKDYFWLTCRLIDSPATINLNTDLSTSGCSNSFQDLNQTKAGINSMPSSATSSSCNLKSSNVNLDQPSSNQTNQDHPVTTNHENFIVINNAPQQPCAVDLFDLCQYLVVAIRNRKTYETRDFSVEDDTLRGMLLMMVMALRRDQTFRYTDTAFEFIHELYDYLFAPANQSQRYLPKCKAPATRSTAFDLMISLVERCPKNYFGLLELLLYDQHNSLVKSSYPTDYWPHDDNRSEVGFVGLINLGATCYLATCMQHLFMIPNLRYAILSIKDTNNIRHGEIIRELQKIFTFMLESERKAYNPRNFCKVYTMDNHPLNIAEQTDMTEFLTDLITKLEESSPELRQIIKELFSGTLSNNVVSLDCSHISRTTEEFYTLRVQVADMRNLNDALDELTVKDTLEGDNMYTCSTCEKKVRAEKRACIVKLPRILCFNTMRYTFNMATMTKEKVNTHFSFPMKLDMADYLETNLMKRQQSSTTSSDYSSKDSSTDSSTSSSSTNYKDEFMTKVSSKQRGEINQSGSDKQGLKENKDKEKTPICSPTNSDTQFKESPSTSSSYTHQKDLDEQIKDLETIYELIGVTVHTGNADGGHYYCFIRDCEDQTHDKPRWYLFNDAEVKPFDDSHIGTECYGGELTTKSYDAINDRFMDFSIEKTNSAYMLFYKRVDYKYNSRSVSQRYLESDTQCSTIFDNIQVLTRQRGEKQCNSKTELKMDAGEIKTLMGVELETPINAQEECTDKDTCEKKLSEIDFNLLSQRTYEDFKLPKYLANWIWADNMKFARDKSVFEHNYFNFMWQICANLPRTLNDIPDNLNHEILQQASGRWSIRQVSEDTVAIRTVHLAIAFVLGVLMNSRERPNLSNWTELIRKQFNSSKAACDWLMHLIDDEETWLKQMLLKCPIEMVRQLFQRLCNDLTGSKQHKKLRLIR